MTWSMAVAGRRGISTLLAATHSQQTIINHDHASLFQPVRHLRPVVPLALVTPATLQEHKSEPIIWLGGTNYR